MATGPSALERLLPTWDFREQHSRVVDGTPADAYAAFRALRIREMPVSRLLFGIRSLPERLTGRGGLPTGSHAALLDLMLDAGFLLLADTPDEEIVVGIVAHVSRSGAAAPVEGIHPYGGGGPAVGLPVADAHAAFLAYERPGSMKTAMTFRFTPASGSRTTVSTETRVLASDRAARRRFGLYWLAIRAFSGLIRREWLVALGRRTATGRVRQR